MSDFDTDALLNAIYGMDTVGVGGMTMTDPMDDLFAPSTSGVGVASSAPALATPSPSPSPPPPPPPPPRPPATQLSTVGVGSVTSRTVSTMAGKRPRPTTAGKRLPGIVNPHRRVGGPPRRRRRRSLLSSSTNSSVGVDGGGGGGGSSDDDDNNDSDASSSSSHPGGRHRMSQEELRRQLELLSNDQVQTASGRRIAGITTTNTITTTYKDGGRPRVARHSSRVSH